MDVNAARHALERLIQQALTSARFTQDSPVLPDVWIAYGLRGGVHDLLLVPHWHSNAVVLASGLHERLRGGPPRADGGEAAASAAIAFTQSTVAARLTLEELVGAALPLSGWWHEYLVEPAAGRPAGDLLALWRDPKSHPHLRASLLEGLHGLRTGAPRGPLRGLDDGQVITSASRLARRVTDDLVWLVEVVGTLHRLLSARPGGLVTVAAEDAAAATRALDGLRGAPEDVLAAFFSLLEPFPGAPPQQALWSVNRNRVGDLAMFRSTATVKADAARKVFGVRGANVRWAVIDSGIDASHLAFRRRGEDGRPRADWREATRVVATYDFSRARERLSEHAAATLGGIAAAFQRSGGVARQASLPLSALRGIAWEEWELRLRVPHDEGYMPPVHKHGTHVAGILAADWRADDSPDDALAALATQHDEDRAGVCPELELYDIRVADASGKCDEFSVIAALQFVRALNARHEHVEIVGVNLSLSLLHDVANYACGRTPVCDECERLVASGVVVVTAAGNQGRARYLTSEGEVDEGYRSISIADPGNAPSVITVGATHRSDPHGYGVSYFSSRGPTGDGRQKPDLVAPGEKVVAPVPGNREEAMDGTSMAAPHVSGAAALILSRHPDLIGRPAEIKRILCATAVDLGRERYFQGAGLLDILHALESI